MKKKVLVSTLAASLVFSSVSILPLGTTGVLDKLGIQTVSASDFSEMPLPELIDLINEMLRDFTEEEQAALREIRARLAALDKDAVREIIAPIWARMEDKVDYDRSKYPDLTLDNLVWLIQRGAAIDQDRLLEELSEWRKDPQVRKIMNQLTKLAGVPGIGMGDFQQFRKKVYEELEALVRKEIPTLMLAISQGRFKEEVDRLLDQAIEIVAQHKSLKISKFIREMNITGDDLKMVRQLFVKHLDPDNKVQLAVAGVMIRSQVAFSAVTSDDGKRLTPKLKLLGYELNNLPYLSWQVESDSDIYVQDGRFILPEGVESAKAEIRAVLTYKNMTMIIYKGSIEMGKSVVNPPGEKPPVNPPGPGKPPVNPPGKPPVNPPGKPPGKPERPKPPNGVKGPDIEKFIKSMTKWIEEIKLSHLEKKYSRNEAVAKAKQMVEEAIRAAAVIDLSKLVEKKNGLITVDYDVDQLEQLFEDAKQIADMANEKLKEVNPDAYPAKAILTLDLGKMNASKAELPIKKALLDLARTNGMNAIAIQFNGLTITLDVDQWEADTTWTLEQQDRSKVSSEQSFASDIYHLSVESDGKPVKSFAKPVEVRFPVSPGNSDQELLVLAKLDEDTTVIKGGRYNPENQTLIAGHKNFSTYGVIENKIAFADLDDVAEWAGRQISVAAARGIVEGRAEGEFVPQEKVTRAEFAKMIVKAFDLEDESAAESFADVSNEDWFQPYVAAAVKSGIVNGRSEDRFEPYAFISRAEMATMASRALMQSRGYKMTSDMDEATEIFTDAAEIHTTLASGVALAAHEGLIVGEDDQRFHPNDDTTRAQAAVMIHRLLDK
ncbi:S-layer homology domain-containing protein [Paenibacillus sp. J2TS4]|uniref:S-layer homology domain-containing protein n=1 Tax=Paenibacillus sp. J2TS4 TaxID=2807194 RepID=UPI001B27D445|nr:S-layer homology domain-containing protein [Paenibacillus sp. J2TS4]GIP35127.1 hypothetical protein J2TS4_43370 [Paenibacillus sp. J2TS4]